MNYTMCMTVLDAGNTDMLPIPRTLHMKSGDGKTNKYQKNVK